MSASVAAETAGRDGRPTAALRNHDRGDRVGEVEVLAGDAVDVGVLAMFVFQMVFMDTAATIPTGALAERWRTARAGG